MMGIIYMCMIIRMCMMNWADSCGVLQRSLTWASSWRPRTTSATLCSGRLSVKTCHAPSQPLRVQPARRCWWAPSPSSSTTAPTSASSYWTSVTSWESGLDSILTTVDCHTFVIVVQLCDCMNIGPTLWQLTRWKPVQCILFGRTVRTLVAAQRWRYSLLIYFMFYLCKLQLCVLSLVYSCSHWDSVYDRFGICAVA